MRNASILTIVFVAIAFISVSATEIDSGFVLGDWYASGNPYNINAFTTIRY